ncbi:PREDICTED: uncharacterized protein LOC108773922 [Cyphomyrmex costatus]|uniref:uncharacterized protein LOC108773922 n=1 Tax=Cyphomyrmex costatus TaxID=456900 RepID=UPI0008523F5F|nr:PREDICTED: uncharacterized protein LOC108773922 [Cyphomyrmex costatus]
MNMKVTDESNKVALQMVLTETRPNRLVEVQDAKYTITDILKRYGPLKAYHGDMIDYEFNAIWPGKDNFLGRFSTQYTPKIIRYINEIRSDLTNFMVTANEDLRALCAIPLLLPTPNYGKGKGCKGKGKSKVLLSNSKIVPKCNKPHPDLIKFISDSEDLVAQTTLEGASAQIQPFLICAQASNEDFKGHFFIRADDIIISLRKDPIHAFDILIKFHYILNVKFAPSLENFYNFIVACIMDIEKPRPICDNLDIILQNSFATTDIIEV